MTDKEQAIRDLLCRHCDGISGGEPCEIKDTCSVLRDAPKQIDEIYHQFGLIPELKLISDEEIRNALHKLYADIKAGADGYSRDVDMVRDKAMLQAQLDADMKEVSK